MIIKTVLDWLLFSIFGIISNNPKFIIDNAISQLTRRLPLRNEVFRFFEYFHREKIEYKNIKLKYIFLITKETYIIIISAVIFRKKYQNIAILALNFLLIILLLFLLILSTSSS
jgi:hypothetical protein